MENNSAEMHAQMQQLRDEIFRAADLQKQHVEESNAAHASFGPQLSNITGMLEHLPMMQAILGRQDDALRALGNAVKEVQGSPSLRRIMEIALGPRYTRYFQGH